MYRVAGVVLSFALSAATVAWALPCQREVTLTELMPLNTWYKQFEITEGKDRSRVVPLTMYNVSAKDGRRKLIFGGYAAILIVSDSRGGLRWNVSI